MFWVGKLSVWKNLIDFHYIRVRKRHIKIQQLLQSVVSEIW